MDTWAGLPDIALINRLVYTAVQLFTHQMSYRSAAVPRSWWKGTHRCRLGRTIQHIFFKLAHYHSIPHSNQEIMLTTKSSIFLPSLDSAGRLSAKGGCACNPKTRSATSLARIDYKLLLAFAWQVDELLHSALRLVRLLFHDHDHYYSFVLYHYRDPADCNEEPTEVECCPRSSDLCRYCLRCRTSYSSSA